MLFEKLFEAIREANKNDSVVITVCGGYKVVPWDEAYRMIEDLVDSMIVDGWIPKEVTEYPETLMDFCEKNGYLYDNYEMILSEFKDRAEQ